MHRFLFMFIFLNFIFIPNITKAQGNAIFSDEDLFNDLLLVLADPDNSRFVLSNRVKEKQEGFLGDFVGSENWEVIEITYDQITIKNVEHNVDSNGNPYEQPTATRIGLSWTGSNCYREALPWLHGGWELAYDPDNSKTDWMFFNNETCKFGLMFHERGSTASPGYSVHHERDGSFTIMVPLVNSQTIILKASADRSRIYNESGAYYTKFTDDFGRFNDRSFVINNSSAMME